MSAAGGTGDVVDAVLVALADPNRRRLLDALVARGRATATDLATELPVTRQAVVKHLTILHDAGLVSGGRRGREVRYSVRPDRLGMAAQSLAEMAAEWDRRLVAFKRAAESGWLHGG